MKKIGTLLASGVVLAGCASVEVAHNQCDQAGWVRGTVPNARCMERSYARQQLTSGRLAGAAVPGVAVSAAAASRPAHPPQTIVVHH